MILDSIFSGDFSAETFSRPADPEYQKLCKEISALLDTIEQQDSQQAEIVKELLDKIYDAHYLESTHLFKIGFAAGMTLQQEVGELLEEMYIDT